MDLTFLVDKQENFSIQVCFFDSFLDVKEKIYKYQGLPISKQNLFFNGKLLKDEDIIINTKLIQDSCIIIKLDQDMPIKITLRVRFPTGYGSLKYFLPVYIDETIMQLKEKIHNKFNFMKINDISIMFPALARVAVLDFQSLGEVGVSNNEIVYVFRKKQKPAKESSQSSKKLNLLIVVRPAIFAMVQGFEMESCAKVSELKKVLKDLYKWFVQGDGRYFFIHEGYVMLENESFEWNQVEDGGIIHLYDIFSPILH
jgi:hypothetical protein